MNKYYVSLSVLLVIVSCNVSERETSELPPISSEIGTVPVVDETSSNDTAPVYTTRDSSVLVTDSFPEIHDSLSTASSTQLFDSVLILNLIQEFDSCAFYANQMLMSDGLKNDEYKHKGNQFYNQAYNRMLHVDQLSIPTERRKIVREALQFYAEVFNSNEIGDQYRTDLAYQTTKIHTLFSTPQSEIKKENSIVINLDYNTSKEIQLPSSGKWCLWEMKGGTRIWLEGDLGGSNGEGRFDIRASQLPIFLGSRKRFMITNAADDFGQYIQLILQPCERN